MNTVKGQVPVKTVDADVLRKTVHREVEAAVMQTVNRALKLTVPEAVEAGLKHALERVAGKKGFAASALPQTTKSAAPRTVKNGVTLPSPGGRCAVVWEALDAMQAKGVNPAVADIRKVAKQKGWNEHNAEIEFYNWRKFNGIGKVTKFPQRRVGDKKAA